MLIKMENITKSFGDREILQQISIQINDGERIGLIGVNGAGKSTLLQILTGDIFPDSGSVTHAKHCKIGYLAQNTGFFSQRTIWEEILPVFSSLLEMKQEMNHLEQEMGKDYILQDEKRYQKILERYAALQESFQENGGYSYEAKMRGVLTGLGLGGIDWKQTPISQLSGGQKTRVLLAKLLLIEPNLLILDEPTNYLDLDAITWLEQMLAQYPSSILLVSHDRYFLDQLVTSIYELENKHLTKYVGNYSQYVKEKQERLFQQQKLYEAQEKEIRRLEDFVQRNIARASTSKRAESKRKVLQKMERIERPTTPKAPATIRFEIAGTSGRKVLEVVDLSIGYDAPLLAPLSFQIERGEHIAILGSNGLGKSTLLKTIAGQLSPLSVKKMKFGSNVQIDYYEQEHRDLHPDKQVLDELWDAHPELDQTTIRNYLGQFLFSGDQVFQKVENLSGGEKARLSLAKRLLNKANFLLMDEPTNHLDLASKEKLEEALKDFPGTILFVSHDRYFIQRIATRIWELNKEGIRDYRGNYEWYLEQKTKEKEAELADSKAPIISSAEQRRLKEKEAKRKQKQFQQKVNELEQEVTELEIRIAKIQEELCTPEVYENLEKAQSLQKELESLELMREEKTAKWLELMEEEP